MLRTLTLLIVIIVPFLVFSQDTEQLLKEAQQQESQFHENEAFLTYTEILKKDPNNLLALWKCSELCSRIGARQTDKEKMRPYFFAARNYAISALRVNPVSSEANCAMAFALGRVSLISSTKERVMLAKDVKHYAENAVQLDPDNFRAYHILGRWNYEVSDLNMAEKSFARVFYGRIPSGTLEEAIVDFEKSRAINPAFILNYLELARSYHRTGEDKKAIANLHILLALPNQIYDDTRAKTIARELLTEWQ
jgi:tetratricopeptide (TPR) repeat protein